MIIIQILILKRVMSIYLLFYNVQLYISICFMVYRKIVLNINIFFCFTQNVRKNVLVFGLFDYIIYIFKIYTTIPSNII